MDYCTTCGALNTLEWTGKYRADNGEKETREVCSMDRCHTRHDWDYNHPWTRGFMAGLEGRVAVCKRCGCQKYCTVD